MNENEKPVSDFIFNPSEWDGATKALIIINVLFFLIIVGGVFILMAGLSTSFLSWLKPLFGL